MWRALLLISLQLLLFGCSPISEKQRDAMVRAAVERQIKDYPHSTLQDIYKSFFQERFGPGHMINDTARAAEFLREELSRVKDSTVMLYEPTGIEGRYCRVSLVAVSNGKVPFNTYFNAFLKSVRAVNECDVKDWIVEWQYIEKIISDMDLDIPAYEADALAIKDMLQKGNYAVHHSKAYNEHYAPHYRIIEKSIFEKEILPLLH